MDYRSYSAVTSVMKLIIDYSIISKMNQHFLNWIQHSHTHTLTHTHTHTHTHAGINESKRKVTKHIKIKKS